MSDKVKAILIAAGIVVGSIVFIIIAVVIYVANEKIVYGQNYYNDDGSVYFSLNSDGTCEMKNTVSCNYEIEEDILHLNAVWSISGSEFDFNVDFEIVDKNELRSTVADINGIEGDFKSSWIAGRTEYKTTTTEAPKPYYQTYTILTLNSGKKATITFAKGGICDVDFSQFNNSNLGSGSGTSRDYLSVTYTSGTCTYEVVDDKNLIINYTGTVNIDYHWYMDYYKKMQTSSMGSYYVLNNAALTFEDNYAKFTFTNGEFVGQTGEVFYYYYKVNENSEIPTTTTKATDVGNSENDIPKTTTKKGETLTTQKGEPTKITTTTRQTTTTKKEETTKTTKKTTVTTTTTKVKNVDTISVKLKDREGIYYCVYLSSSGDYYARNDYYVVSVNNEDYRINTDFPAVCYDYTKAGNHCLDVTVTDSDGNKKAFKNQCINFTPVKLNYTASVSQATGGYYLSFGNRDDDSKYNSSHYNHVRNVTIYHNGTKVDSRYNDSFYIGAWNSCNHTIKVVNKYGDSQTFNLTC